MEETTCNVGRTDQFETENGCPICLEKFVGNRPIRVLPCRHRYHSDCVDDWLVRRRRCPLCGYDILRNYKNAWLFKKCLLLYCTARSFKFLLFTLNVLLWFSITVFEMCNFEFVIHTCMFLFLKFYFWYPNMKIVRSCLLKNNIWLFCVICRKYVWIVDWP